jgi:anti-sigma factor RsiW
MLERIGAYVAGELSGEEAREVERLILEEPEAPGLAESYTRLLACLSAAGRESPAPPPAIIDHAVWWARHSCVDPREPGAAAAGCRKSRTRRYRKGGPKR